MAQSFVSESSISGVPPFWQSHSIDLSTPWKDWGDMFQLALIAKENIDSLLNPLEFLEPDILQLAGEPQNKSTTAKTERLARNAEVKSRFSDCESSPIKLRTKIFNGMRIEEANKKIQSMLYLALESENKRVF